MSKPAITYYKDTLRGATAITVHPSGVEAINHFKKHVQDFFTQPVVLKQNISISNKKRFSVRIGMRGYHVRFLEPEEAETYNLYKDECLFNIQEEKLIAPTR